MHSQSSRPRVLFLCTGNAARSQMAEALLRQLSNGQVDAFSAGSVPASEVLPAARAVLEELFAIDTSALSPKSVDTFVGQHFDVVITVCDAAAERCPIFPGTPRRLHWSFEDPARAPDPNAQRRACEEVANGLAARLRDFLIQIN